jgi:hypothetical protein
VSPKKTGDANFCPQCPHLMDELLIFAMQPKIHHTLVARNDGTEPESHVRPEAPR